MIKQKKEKSVANVIVEQRELIGVDLTELVMKDSLQTYSC